MTEAATAPPLSEEHDLLLRRALMWINLLVDTAGVEPAETSIRVSVPHSEDDAGILVEISLAADIAALETLVGPGTDFNDGSWERGAS